MGHETATSVIEWMAVFMLVRPFTGAGSAPLGRELLMP